MKLALLLSSLSLALAADRIPLASDFAVEKTIGLENNSTLHVRTCSDAGYGPCVDQPFCCPIGGICCSNSCAPPGSQCCYDGNYCPPGNQCYLPQLGETGIKCCTNSLCTAYVNPNGVTTTFTQTYTYYVTITYYTYYYGYFRTIESDYNYFYTTYYIEAVNTAQASASVAAISSSLEAVFSARYTPPPLPSIAASTEPSLTTTSSSSDDNSDAEPQDFTPSPEPTTPPESHTLTPELNTQPEPTTGPSHNLLSALGPSSGATSSTTSRSQIIFSGDPTTPVVPPAITPPSGASTSSARDKLIAIVLVATAVGTAIGMLAL